MVKFMKLLFMQLLVCLVVLIKPLTCSPSQEEHAYYPYFENRWFLDLRRYREGAHGDFSCERCHKEIGSEGKRHPDQAIQGFLKKPAVERFDYSICETCHALAGASTKKGIHFELPARKKNPDSAFAKLPQPRCGHCHDSHYDMVVRDRFEVGKTAVNRCKMCHKDQVEAYLENIHGRKAYYLKDKKAPFCSDCHGAHEVVSLKDKNVALEICQRCHPKAGPNITESVIHRAKLEALSPGHPKEANITILKSLGSVALVFVLGVIILSTFHTLLWLLREIQKTLRKRR